MTKSSPAHVLAGPKARRRSDPTGWVRYLVIAQWGRAYADALKTACQQAFPQAEIVCCCTGAETLAALRTRAADLLLLTMAMPDMDGLDLIHATTNENLARRVLLGCRRRDEHCLHSLRNARFDGIVDTLDENMDTLIGALRTVASGEAFFSEAFRDIVIDRANPSEIWQQLTPAEIRVLTIIGDGSDDHEAAVELGLRPTTVQTHRRNIMRKLNVPTSAKLVRESIRLGLIRISHDGNIIRPGCFGDTAANPAGAQDKEFLPTGST